jgi:hypothetical protein
MSATKLATLSQKPIPSPDKTIEYAMIDNTIVRADQHTAGAQKKTAKTKRSGAAKGD